MAQTFAREERELYSYYITQKGDGSQCLFVSLHVFICLFNCFGHVGKFLIWWRGVIKIQSPIPRHVCVAGAGELRDYEIKNAASSDPVSAPTKYINHPKFPIFLSHGIPYMFLTDLLHSYLLVEYEEIIAFFYFFFAWEWDLIALFKY